MTKVGNATEVVVTSVPSGTFKLGKWVYGRDGEPGVGGGGGQTMRRPTVLSAI